MKPEWCSQDVWNTVVAIDLMDWVNNLDGDRDPKEAIARAIMAAKAEERERSKQYLLDLYAVLDAYMWAKRPSRFPKGGSLYGDVMESLADSVIADGYPQEYDKMSPSWTKELRQREIIKDMWEKPNEQQ